MTSQTRKQIITTPTVPDILRSKSNQENKFVQLIEYNTRNNFAEKSYRKCDGENSISHFKNSVSLDQKSKVLYSLFLYCAHFENYRNILKLSADHLLVLDMTF